MHLGRARERGYLDFAPVGGRYDEMRPGSFDTKARLADMDIDGIHLQVLYPSVTLLGAKIYGSEPELQVACVRAYNDWLAEFCEGSDGRLIGQAILPTTGTSKTGPTNMNTPQFMGVAGATKSGANTLPVVCKLLFSGVFERFHDVQLLLVESNIGWIPTLLEQVDDMFYRYRFFTNGDAMRVTPSRIFHRNFWATFMIDTVGMDLRHRLNVDQLMWSSDYPHTGTDWPNSRITIERNFRGLPKLEVKKMLHDNCKRLYHLDVPDRLPYL